MGPLKKLLLFCSLSVLGHLKDSEDETQEVLSSYDPGLSSDPLYYLLPLLTAGQAAVRLCHHDDTVTSLRGGSVCKKTEENSSINLCLRREPSPVPILCCA